MLEFLYVTAFVLLVSGAVIGGKMDQGLAVNRAPNPTLTTNITSLSGFVGIIWFGLGFFLFQWWLPLLALPVSIALSAFMAVYVLRLGFAPLWAMLISILGVVLTIYILITVI